MCSSDLRAARSASVRGPGPCGAERAALEAPRDVTGAPDAVRGDYPDWLDASMARAFGEARAEEGAALSERAPVDLRVNLLKSDPERTLKALSSLLAQPTDVLTASCASCSTGRT